MADVIVSDDVDKGWAWVVLFASTVILTSMSVFNTTIGIFQVEFLDAFHGSQGLVALVGSVNFSSQFLYGPVVGVISNLVSHRVLVMVGAALLSLGLVSASFCQDLLSLFALFGVVCGLGGGLLYTPTVTVVSTYFYRFRTLANGISLAAPGIGLIVAPYLAGWLIENYGWRFALVCYGCGMAQMCVLASLFFPRGSHKMPACCGGAHASSSTLKRTPEIRTLKPYALQNGDLKTHVQNGDLKTHVQNGDLKKVQVQSGDLNTHFQNGDLKVTPRSDFGVMVTDLESGSRSGSLLRVSEFGSMMMSHCSVAWSVDDIKPEKIRHQIRRVLGSRFLWVMCLNQFLLIAGFSVTFILFPAYAQSSLGLSVDHDVPLVYTAYGVTITLSRVAAGVLFSFIPGHLLRGFFLVQLGYAAVLTLMPLVCSSLASVLICKSFIGLTYGPSFGLLAPILVRYVGLSDLPLAFGVVLLTSGVGCVVAPPIAGVLYDIFGNYDVCFYVAGFTIGAAALSLLLLLLVKDKQPFEDGISSQECSSSSSSDSKQKEALLADTNRTESDTVSSSGYSDTAP